MPALVGNVLSILTFFVTLKTMLTKWWDARSNPANTPLPPPSPKESIIRRNAVSPVQLDKLSIRSFGVDLKDPSHEKLHDRILGDLQCTKDVLDPSLLKRSSDKGEPFARDQYITNDIFDLLFGKSRRNDNFQVNDPVQMYVDGSNEGRVYAVGCSGENSRIQQENDKDTKRESLPVKTDSQSSVSTTASCHMVWVPWRVWIEHMRNAEITFHWVNPFRKLRKKTKSKTRPSNGSTDSKEGQNKNTTNTVEVAVYPEPSSTDSKEGQNKNTTNTVGVAVYPEPSSTDSKEGQNKNTTNAVQVPVYPEPSSTDSKEGQNKNTTNAVQVPVYPEPSSTDKEEPTNNHGSFSNGVNAGCVRATLVENWCNRIRYFLRWRIPFSRSRANSYTADQHATEVRGERLTDVHGRYDKTISEVDRNGKTNSDKDDAAIEASSYKASIKNAWMKVMDKERPNTPNAVKKACRYESAGTKDSSSLQTSSVPSTTSKSQNSDASQLLTTKVNGNKNAQTQSTNPQNRTTVCTFVHSFKNARFSWNNPFKSTVPAGKGDIERTRSTDDQVVPGSLENDRSQNIKETPVIAFSNVIVTSEDARTESVTLDAGHDTPGTTADTPVAANNEVNGIKDAQNTITNPRNRTTVCAFVRSFKDAKFSWNSPFKRTVPAGKGVIERTGSTTDKVIQGTLENDRSHRIPESPVLSTVTGNTQVPLITPARMYKPAGRPVPAWGMEIDVEASTNNRVYGIRTLNSYTPASLFLATNLSHAQPSQAIPTSSKEPTTNSEVPPATSQLQPSETIPSSLNGPTKESGIGRASGKPSSSTVPSTESTNKKKRFSFFRSKSKHAREGPKQGRLSKRRNTIRPL